MRAMAKLRRGLSRVFLAAALCSPLCAAPADPFDAAAAVGKTLARVESRSPAILAGTGAELLGRFADGALLATFPARDGERLKAAGVPLEVLDERVAGPDYWFLGMRDRADLDRLPPDVAVLSLSASEVLVRAPQALAETLPELGFALRRVTLNAKPLSSTAAAQSWEVHFDPRVDALIDAVSTPWLMTAVQNLSGVNPVVVGGSPYTIQTRNSYKVEPIQKVTQHCYEFFQSLGLEVSYHLFDGPGGRNVIAREPGVGDPDKVVVFCAHLDDMPGSGGLAPGADDNASGSAAVLAAAQLTKNLAFDRTIVFALWTGEEQGLVGSAFYARDAYTEGMQIVGVLNLDMVSYDGYGSPDLDLHATPSDAVSLPLCRLFQEVTATYGINLAPVILNDGNMYSDHASFWDYDYPALLAIESHSDFTPHYHTTGDLVSTLNPDYFTHCVQASLGTLVHLAGLRYSADDLARLGAVLTGNRLPPGGGAVFGDLNSDGHVDAVDYVELQREVPGR